MVITRGATTAEQVCQQGIPFMIILGEEEVKQGVVKMKDMTKHTEEVRLPGTQSRALVTLLYLFGLGRRTGVTEGLLCST